MIKNSRFIGVLAIIICSFLLSSCTIVDNLEVKLGINNREFEYLNTENIEEVSIQSTRDLGFKFIVRENHAIKELYNLLKKAKVTTQKTELDPDYIFKIQVGDNIREFYYVVGAEGGNFYDSEKIYSVSNRLDESIMQNLSILNKPRDFEEVYYGCILDVLKLKKEELSSADHKVGINIQGDVDTLKYIFSSDVEKFLDDARKITPNIEIISKINDDYDTIISLKNRGYSQSIYKTKITVNNKKDKIQEDFYVIAEYKFKEWECTISEPNKVPDKW